MPISIFLTGAPGEMSKSKISMGRPSVMQAFGIYKRSNQLLDLGRYDERIVIGRDAHIDKASNMTLNRSAAQEEIDLVVAVTCTQSLTPVFELQTHGQSCREGLRTNHIASDTQCTSTSFRDTPLLHLSSTASPYDPR